MTPAELRALKRGAIVRRNGDSYTYVVVHRDHDCVIISRSLDLRAPSVDVSEWNEVVKSRRLHEGD